jgi:hypothetical protein
MEIMIPVWEQSEAAAQTAGSRLSGVRDSRIALVDDNFDTPFTDQLEKVLRANYGAIVDRLVKPLGSATSPKTLLEQAAKADAAIVGIGL